MEDMSQPRSALEVEGGVEVFIGRVTTVPQHVIEAAFLPYGARNIRMMHGQDIAFANFATWGSAERAIQGLNGIKLHQGLGEGLNVKFADYKGEKKQERAPRPRVFIGCLNSFVTEEAIAELCGQFGTVKETTVLRKKVGQAPCAFVTFSLQAEAELAISVLHGFQHDLSAQGKTLRVKHADLERKEDEPGFNNQQAALDPSVSGDSTGLLRSIIVPPETADGNSPQIFIGGLSDTCTDEFVQGMMAQFGQVTEAFVHKKKGASSHVGFARFAHLASAQMAVATINQLGLYHIKFSEWNISDEQPKKWAKKSHYNEQDYERKPGDWNCDFCADLQFAKNKLCRRCKMPKKMWPPTQESWEQKDY